MLPRPRDLRNQALTNRRPYTPRTSGKAERFIQTLLREWAYALPYRFSGTRAADLPRWLRHYNQEQPNATLARQSPIAWLRLTPEQSARKTTVNHALGSTIKQ